MTKKDLCRLSCSPNPALSLWICAVLSSRFKAVTTTYLRGEMSITETSVKLSSALLLGLNESKASPQFRSHFPHPPTLPALPISYSCPDLRDWQRSRLIDKTAFTCNRGYDLTYTTTPHHVEQGPWIHCNACYQLTLRAIIPRPSGDTCHENINWRRCHAT